MEIWISGISNGRRWPRWRGWDPLIENHCFKGCYLSDSSWGKVDRPGKFWGQGRERRPSPWNYQGLSPAENFNINSISSEGHQHKDNIPFIHRYFVIVAIARLKASPYMTLAGPHSFSQGVLGISKKELAVYTEIFCLPASPWARLSPYQLESCQEPRGDLT